MKERKEIYHGQTSLEELQKKFFIQFNYNFWMHKARVLRYFIDNIETIEKLKFKGDIYSEVIAENLKMELHMTVFHSSESLFRIIFSIIKMPELPWICNNRHGCVLILQLLF